MNFVAPWKWCLCNRNYMMHLIAPRFSKTLHMSRILQDTFHVQDEEDFEARVIKSNVPVIIDFHATWCNPCKLLDPRIEKAAERYAGKISVAKVDIDKLPDVAMNYEVASVPSVIAIKDGKVADRFVGVQDEDKVDKFFAKLASG